jgi:hypothetical protein
MRPRTIHHVFPYHVRHIADDEAGWWEAQLGVWPVAAALLGDRRADTHVHVIGERPVADPRLTVHPGTLAGPGTEPFGSDLSLPLLQAMQRLGSGDVCFVHGSDSAAGALCAEAARPATVVAVYHAGATGGRDRLKDLATRHVVLRREITETLVAAGYDPTTIVELTPSIAPGFFDVHRSTRPAGHVVVGFVGRPTEGKGVDAIAPAVRRIRGTGRQVAVEVVGATHLDDVDPLRAELFEAGAPLESYGYLPNAALPSIMAGWDVLLLPSHFEGCPRSLLEAAAIGVPVVAVAGVVPDKVVDGDLVRAVDRADLPAAVVDALDAPHDPEATGPARPHHDGAAAFDHLVAELPVPAGSPGFSPAAATRNLAAVLRRCEPLLRRLRPVVRLVRPGPPSDPPT